MTNKFSSEAIRGEFEQRYINYNLIRADEGYVAESTEHLWCLFKDFKFANAYQEARIEGLITKSTKLEATLAEHDEAMSFIFTANLIFVICAPRLHTARRND